MGRWRRSAGGWIIGEFLSGDARAQVEIRNAQPEHLTQCSDLYCTHSDSLVPGALSLDDCFGITTPATILTVAVPIGCFDGRD